MEKIFLKSKEFKKYSHAQLSCPADKSITHRAYFFEAFSNAPCDIQNPLISEDTLCTQRALKGGEVVDAGNSGTTARLLLGFLSARVGAKTQIRGDASLSRRPMQRVIEPLQQFGAHIIGGTTLPLEIRGKKLEPVFKYDCKIASAQVKTALIFAALQNQSSLELTLPAGSRDHTENFLKFLKIPIQKEISSNHEFISLKPPYSFSRFSLYVPGDPSSLAFFFLMANFFPNVHYTAERILTNPSRVFYFSILNQLGFHIEIKNQHLGNVESFGNVYFFKKNYGEAVYLNSQESALCIDEIPTLAVLSSFSPGVHRFCDVAELETKESNRVKKTQELIHLSGGRSEYNGQDLVVFGSLREKISSFSFNPDGDHRMAMIAVMLSLAADEMSSIKNLETIATSFPNFLDFSYIKFDEKIFT